MGFGGLHEFLLFPGIGVEEKRRECTSMTGVHVDWRAKNCNSVTCSAFSDTLSCAVIFS